ncbi:MAG: hypothetical protein GY722_04245 [bacterium]|nr:hypothetical protein [bacterium]
MSSSNRRSVAGIAVAFVIGVLVILAGGSGSATVGPIAVFAVCGLLAYAINWLVFVLSSIAKTECTISTSPAA